MGRNVDARLSSFFNEPTWLIWSIALWVPPLVAWLPAWAIAAANHADRREQITVVAVCGAAALLATMAYGARLAYRREWGYLGWAPVVAAVPFGVVTFFTFSSAQSGTSDDPGVGLGALAVTVLMLPCVAVFVWLGAALGVLVRRVGTPSRLQM